MVNAPLIPENTPHRPENDAFSREVELNACLKENHDSFLNYAKKQVRVEEEAKDILQKATMQLVRAVGSGKFDGDAAAWPGYIYTAIRHLAMDQGRRDDAHARKLQNFRDALVLDEREFPEPWLCTVLDGEHQSSRVMELLRSLDHKYTEVVHLRIWGELTFQQISDMTGLSLGTVTSRYRKAVELMREELARKPLD